MVKVNRVAAPAERLLDPGAPEWASPPRAALSLAPTPLASQPSAYVRARWQEQPYGTVPEIEVRAAHNGEAAFFRLSWADATRDDAIGDTDVFTDAAAVLFPRGADAPLTAMGSPELPVLAWYWRPDLEAPLLVSAQGLGTTARSGSGGLAAQWSYDRGWSLVVSGPLAAADGPAGLRPGKTGKVAFAVWQGSNGERAGLKAVTLEWQPLELAE